MKGATGEANGSRACSAPIESGGFSWGRGWERLSALIRFWEAGRCQRPILGRCGSERLRRSKVELRGARRPRNLRLVPAPQLSGSSAFGRRAAARPNRGAEAPHHWRSMRIFYWVEVVLAMRKHKIPGGRTAVWRFFKRHKITFKKKPARSGARARGRGAGAPALDARTGHV